MLKERWYPVAYMFVLMFFFSSLIIGFNIFTRERVNANDKIAVEKAVVEVIPGLFDEKMKSSDIHNTFIQNISLTDEPASGVYQYRDKTNLSSYAVPFSGRGFWAPIKGFIGIASDRKTVTGISFYEQSETPGLGAEITKPAFRKQFEGKLLAEGKKPLRFKRAGEALSENDIESISGATQTCTRLEKIVNTALGEWRGKFDKD